MQKFLFDTPSVAQSKPRSQPNKCQHCGGDFRLNVVCDRQSKIKYLRAGCCDVALRRCPDPEHLAKSPLITPEERDYLRRVAGLPWFSGQVAVVLLQLEARVNSGIGEVAA